MVTSAPAEAAFVAALRGAAAYVHAHHGRVFVVAFGGDTAARADFPELLHDLALLHSLGVKLVLVHGLRPQIDAQMQARGLQPMFSRDLRVTDAAAMECVKAAAGILRADIEAQLSAGLANTPMGSAHLALAGGNWITARPVGVRDGIDHQLTGEVRHVALGAIRDVLARDCIALLSPIGYSPSGEAFNLRAGDVAGAVAAGLGADKLIFVLDSDLRGWRRLLRSRTAGHLSLDELEAFLRHPRRKPLAAENRTLLEAALTAGHHGVARVHLVGAANDGALLRELYTRDGCGLMFYADADYETLRPATLDDIGGIQALIAPLETQGVLVARSRERLELDIGHFDVAVRDGTVIACAATYPFPDAGVAEFACVAVHPDYRDAGYAAALLARAESRTRAAGGTHLFALTTRTPHWFIEHGFTRAKVEELPIEKRELYNWQRKSLVLVKPL